MADIREHFQDVEIEHDLKTFYATGTVDINIRETYGGNYEGYDFERVSDSKVSTIDFEEIYYIDEDVNDAVQVLGEYKYRDIEKLAREIVASTFN